MQIGRYRVSVHHHGFFRLDGGAMFGAVPKPLWSRVAPPDDQNRILMATRSLVLDDGNRRMVVDLGCGDKWNEKTRAIFDFPSTPYRPVAAVTDVLLTHFHFDHAGGVSRLESDQAVPNYPGAVHHVPRANYENARNPNVRERASYLAENLDVLEATETRFTDDGDEIWPGVTVHRSDGHTRGLQWVKVSDGGVTVAYPSDLIPTSNHLPIPYAMGYDMCAQTVMEERSRFLEAAVAGRWVVVFEHDPEVGAARLAFDERGRALVAEKVSLPGDRLADAP